MCVMKVSSSVLSTVGVALLFLIDLTVGLQNFVPQSVSKAVIFVLLLFIYIYLSTRLKGLAKADYLKLIVNSYLLFLFIRIVNDFILHDNYFFMYKTPITLLFFVLNLIIVPGFFYQKYSIRLNINLLNNILFVCLGLFLLLSIRDNLSGEISPTTNDRYTGYGGLDIIYYGHLGVSLIIVGTSILRNSHNRKLKILLFLICVLIGFFSLVFSGSRGPFIALCVVFLYKYFSSIKSIKSFGLLVVLIVLMCILYDDIIWGLNNFLQEFEITSFSRIAMSVVEGMSSSGRGQIYANAFNDFLDFPLFGKSYLLDDGSYVHNIVIEQFRALGFFGGLLFLIMNLVVIWRGFILLKQKPEYSIIPMLFLQYFVYGMFSRTIIALPQYWLCFFCINNLYNEYVKSVGYNSYIQKPRRITEIY